MGTNSDRFDPVSAIGHKPTSVLDPLWVSGGVGSDGVDYVGCWDKPGSLGNTEDISDDLFVVATADPSPSQY